MKQNRGGREEERTRSYLLVIYQGLETKIS